MSHIPKVMHAFARLLTYPHEYTAQTAELLYVVLHDEIPDAADDISQFGRFIEQHSIWEVEEAFTATFDVNPECALEVGWHLFGEEYARGLFLVRMREELRKYDLPESSELTDHISHVLTVVAAMPKEEARRFVTACVQAAVEKMNVALAKKDTPYRHVFSALAKVLKQKWGAGHSPAEQDILESRPSGVDPLHAFPVAAVGCESECGGSCAEAGLVQLDSQVPASREHHATGKGEEHRS